MQITDKQKIETCFDGSQVFRYTMSSPWDEHHIHTLAALGKLAYYPNFPRPFFRSRQADGFEIKGVEGESTCMVIIPADKMQYIERIEHHFSSDKASTH